MNDFLIIVTNKTYKMDLCSKQSNGKAVIKIRLVVKSFQDIETGNFRNDSLTDFKGLLIAMGIISSNRQSFRSMDLEITLL